MISIVIKGARENNLKNVDLVIPRNKLVCFVGVSGSGKSTLAFDIVARECERQYFESLPAFARRYLHKSNKPDIDSISGISSAIILDQRRIHGSPRSTVGTVTEAYTYLRLLYSRVGLPSKDSSHYSFNHPDGFCPKCKGLGRSAEVNLSKLLDQSKSLNEGALIPSEWYVDGRQWSIIKATGYFDMDKKVGDFNPAELDRLLHAKPETVQANSGVLVDRFTFQGVVHRIMHRNTKVHRGPSESDMKYFEFVDCPECKGFRLNSEALAVRLHGMHIGEVAQLPLDKCRVFVESITHPNAEAIKPGLLAQINNLISVGVGYLSLNRSTDTLSGGEAQRVKMARQLGSSLIESIYVLDEPTAGLHRRDVNEVIKTLKQLRDQGNTILVVEHDRSVMRSADHLIEVGPGGGSLGGTIIAQGSPEEIEANPASLTGSFLSGITSIKPKHRYRTPIDWLDLPNVTRNNLQNITVRIPLGVMTAITGVSGSGKSSLIDELVQRKGDQVVLIDQQAIGKNMRGCIATYSGIFDKIRKLFAQANHVSERNFSFNSAGACPHCKGIGFQVIDMNFLGDISVKCSKCNGLRYKENILSYHYNGRTIAEVLKMTVQEALAVFPQSTIHDQLELLNKVGLSYIELGQSLSMLSGGESQRLKLASNLSTHGEIYILDEPSSGLHDADVEKLLATLNDLVEHGNTVIVVEHNVDIVKNADWVIDLGPEGGEQGGRIIAEGTPAQVAKFQSSYTGKYLCAELAV